MQLLVPIVANVVLGTALLALFRWHRTVDAASLDNGDEALRLFRTQFPDADGVATLTADRRGALVALRDGTGIGLLQRRGRRWTARLLTPRDVRSVAVSHGDTLILSLADFGWPRARLQVPDPEARAVWAARLESFVAGDAGRRSPVSSDA